MTREAQLVGIHMGIHNSAVIDRRATIGKNNEIGPHVVIDGPAVIGDNNTIGPSTIITGPTTIGDNNHISGHVYLGNLPQDLSFKGVTSFVKIGNGNTLREFTNIHRGTKEESSTIIGDNNYLMVSTHIGHNCTLGNSIIMVNGASLGGYVEVKDHAFLSAYVIVHQFVRVGGYCICGILSKIVKDVPPYMMVDGNPSLVRGVNVVGLKRKGFDAARRERIRTAYKILYRYDYGLPHALEELRKMNDEDDIQVLIDFIENSRRGILLKSPKTAELHE
jgi:UDP-N-acetylglucosamine acyltransferase